MRRPREFAGILTGIMDRLKYWATNTSLDMVAHWLLHMDRWLSKNPLPPVKRPHIVNVDLGVNYEGEMSFVHPCIVLRALANWAIVIPVTSKRYGNGTLVDVEKETVAAQPTNPQDEYKNQFDFIMPKTGIPSSVSVEQLRMISKQRIIDVWRYPPEKEGELGEPVEAHNVLLRAIDEKIAVLIAPTVRFGITTRDKDIRTLKAELQVAQAEVERLTRELQFAAGKH